MPTTNKETIEINKSSLAPISIIFFGGDYLGSRLAEKLLEKDSRVIVVDQFDSEKEMYFLNLRDNPKLLLINTDLKDRIPPQINTVDYIYINNYFDYFEDLENNKVQNLEVIENIYKLADKSKAKIEIVSNIKVKNKEKSKQYEFQDKFRELFKLGKPDSKLDVREVLLPIIYGPKMSLEKTKGLGKILDSYLNQTIVRLNDENRFKNFYLFIDDAVIGIVKTIFSEKSKGSQIVLSDLNAHSEMEIGSLLKNIASRHVDFEYYEDNSRFIWEIPEEKNLHLIGYAPKIKLKEGIIRTLNYYGYEPNDFTYRPIDVNKNQTGTTEKASSPLLKVKNAPTFKEHQRFEKKIEKLRPKIKWSEIKYLLITGVISLILIFIVLPLLTIYINFWWAQNNFNSFKRVLSEGNIREATILTSETTKNVEAAQNGFKRFESTFILFSGEKKYQEYENLLLSLSSFSQGATPFLEALTPFVDLQRNIQEQQEIDEEVFSESATKLENSLELFLMAEQFLEDSATENKNPELIMYQENLPKIIKLNRLLLGISKDYREFLGYNKPHKVLILFQNPSEIRATGGFIGSYGIIEVSKGKIISIKIDDIYNPDGQIDLQNIVVIPPQAVEDYLNERKLYIRNANFSPDFPTSARIINNLFNLAVKEDFDTIIAIDYFFIKEFLKNFGNVFLSSYNEEISAENFVERAQFHSEFNYQPGVSEKKSFLTNLGSKLLENFVSLKAADLVKGSESVYTLLENGNIKVYSRLPRLNSSLKELNWDGALRETTGDYLKIVNSNLGGNKVNYLIKNFYKYEVVSKTRDGVLRSVLSLNYQNLAENDSWPYGTYKNFVRVLVPTGSKLTKASLVSSSGETRNVFSEVKIGMESIYQTFEYGIEVKPQETQTLNLEYDLPENLNIDKDENTSYSLIWQNQSGENTRIEYNFYPPYGFNIGQVFSEKEIKFQDNQATFSDEQKGTLSLGIELK